MSVWRQCLFDMDLNPQMPKQELALVNVDAASVRRGGEGVCPNLTMVGNWGIGQISQPYDL